MLCAGRGTGWGSAKGCGAVEPFQELPRGPEVHVPLGRHVHGLSGSRIAARPGDPDLARKTAEPAQLHPMTLAEGLGDLVQDRVERRLHGMEGQMRMGLAKLCQQLRTDHRASSGVSQGHEQASPMPRPAA